VPIDILLTLPLTFHHHRNHSLSGLPLKVSNLTPTTSLLETPLTHHPQILIPQRAMAEPVITDAFYQALVSTAENAVRQAEIELGLAQESLQLKTDISNSLTIDYQVTKFIDANAMQISRDPDSYSFADIMLPPPLQVIVANPHLAGSSLRAIARAKEDLEDLLDTLRAETGYEQVRLGSELSARAGVEAQIAENHWQRAEFEVIQDKQAVKLAEETLLDVKLALFTARMTAVLGIGMDDEEE